MKHLKRFNENNSEKELETFCNDYLAYLLDDKSFKYTISKPAPIFDISYEVTLEKVNGDNFEWDEIKDYFIPFVSVLNDNFALDEILFKNNYATPSYITNIKTKNSNIININDILNDSLTEKEKDFITEITLTLNGIFKKI